jgi:hypothetical protein
MKFTRFFAVIILFLAISCRKERTCQCTNSNGSYESGALESTRTYAKKYCKSLSSEDTNCELKK